MLLHNVGTPASNAAGNEDRGVLGYGNAHCEVSHATGEINIGVDLLGIEHDLLNMIPKVEPLPGGGVFLVGVLEPPVTKNPGTVVAVLVHTVAEPQLI